MPKRKPATASIAIEVASKPITPEQLHAGAKAALSMTRTILEYLPIKGEAGLKSDINVIDSWFQSAGEDYTTFERIRNPARLPWPGMGIGTFHVAAPSSKAVAYFAELCRAMAHICEAYSWQGLSDGSRIPHSMQRHGTSLIPQIDAKLLHAVAVAGQGLVEEFDPSDVAGRQLVEKLAIRGHDNVKNGTNNLPENPDVLELCRHLKAKRSKFGTIIECARDFCRRELDDESKANSLLRQAKRFPHLWRP